MCYINYLIKLFRLGVYFLPLAYSSDKINLEDEQNKTLLYTYSSQLEALPSFNYHELKEVCRKLNKASIKNIASKISLERWVYIKNEIQYFKKVPFDSLELLETFYNDEESNLIRLGAYLNDLDSQVTLSVFHALGTAGLEKDYYKSSKWLLKAINNNPDYSLYNTRLHTYGLMLGILYIDQDNITIDDLVNKIKQILE